MTGLDEDGSSVSLVREARVARVELRRPGKRNALRHAELNTLRSVLDELRLDASVDVVILSGQGASFCSGVDHSLVKTVTATDAICDLVTVASDVVQGFESLPQFTVAVVHGAAIGIGLHLALACDFVLVDANSRMQFPEASMGLPDVLHSRLLARALGRSASLELSLLCERLSPVVALRAGLAYRVCENRQEMDVELNLLRRRLLEVSPVVRRAAKRAEAKLGERSHAQLQNAAVRQAWMERSSA